MPNFSRYISLVIFLLSYVLFVFFPNRRMQIAVGGALLLLLLGVVSLREAFFAINWNVMGMFVGMLVVADVFMLSHVPAYLAEMIVNRAKSTAWAILFICLMTGIISAFVENVATVLIIAPVALSLAKKLKINPVNMMIAIAVSSNLQGTATLIGDPPSMLLGGFFGMNFGDFFFYHGKPSIFWAVELGALASLVVLYFVFHGHREKTQLVSVEKVKSWIPAFLLSALILSLILSSFFDHRFPCAAGVLCMIFAGVSLIWAQIYHAVPVIKGIRSLDWETTFFLAGIFVLVGSLTHSGWIESVSVFLSNAVGQDLFLGYTALVFFSVLISAFVDNVPYLAAMLPVALSMAGRLEANPALFLFGLLIGASLGGNMTPIGASANIVACGILKKEGQAVSFGKFMRIGVPFTLAAVIPAYLFVWLLWR